MVSTLLYIHCYTLVVKSVSFPQHCFPPEVPAAVESNDLRKDWKSLYMHVNQNSDNHRMFSFIVCLSLAQLYSRLCFYWSCEGVSQIAAVKVQLTVLNSIAYLCLSWPYVCFSSFQSSWTLYFSGFDIMRFLVCLVFMLFLICVVLWGLSLVLGSLCVPLPP